MSRGSIDKTDNCDIAKDQHVRNEMRVEAMNPDCAEAIERIFAVVLPLARSFTPEVREGLRNMVSDLCMIVDDDDGWSPNEKQVAALSWIEEHAGETNHEG